VACFLFALGLSLDLYFAGSQKTVAQQIEAAGLGRVVVTNFSYGSRMPGKATALSPLLDKLADNGYYAYLRRLSQQAQVELLGDAHVLMYRDQDLIDLREFFPGFEGAGALLLTARREFPHGTRLNAKLGSLEWGARVIQTSQTALEALGRKQVLLLPAEWPLPQGDGSYIEVILFESSARDSASIRAQIGKIRQLLTLDEISTANLQSSLPLLNRLEAMQQQQARWSTTVRSIVAILIILVFASSAFLEYRENAYLSALLQSMGVPRIFLLLRYLVEHALLLIFAFSLCCGALTYLLTEPVALPSMLTNDLIGLFSPLQAFYSWLWVLTISLALSLLPILAGLRKEIGRILQ